MNRRWAAPVLASLVLFGCKEPPQTGRTATPPTATKPAPDAKPTRVLNDAHVHVSPYAADLFIQAMDANGIHRVANLSGGAGDERQAMSLGLIEKFPGRIAPFMNVDWSDVENPEFGKNAARKLEHAVSQGFAGLKISKALGLGVSIGDELMKVDDPRLDPLWDKAGELGVPVAIHTSDPKAFFEKPGPQNERHAELSYAPSWSFYGEEFPSRESLLAARDRVVERHPNTTFILLHFANNPEDIEYVDRVLSTYPNAVVDVAARVGEIGRHDAARVREIFEKHQDRILFATDIQMSVVPKDDKAYLHLTLGSVSEKPPTPTDIGPFYDAHFAWLETRGEPIDHPVPIQGDWKVNPINLSASVLERVYFKNSERVIFAPWLARGTATAVVKTARSFAD